MNLMTVVPNAGRVRPTAYVPSYEAAGKLGTDPNPPAFSSYRSPAGAGRIWKAMYGTLANGFFDTLDFEPEEVKTVRDEAQLHMKVTVSPAGGPEISYLISDFVLLDAWSLYEVGREIAKIFNRVVAAGKPGQSSNALLRLR